MMDSWIFTVTIIVVLSVIVVAGLGYYFVDKMFSIIDPELEDDDA